jgi:hypothetical protein
MFTVGLLHPADTGVFILRAKIVFIMIRKIGGTPLYQNLVFF